MTLSISDLEPGMVLQDKLTGERVTVLGYFTEPAVTIERENGSRITIGVRGLTWANYEKVQTP